MAQNSIDAKMLTNMFLAGAKNLEHKKEWINELNVFPVPDGDTGTNMTMTIMAAAKEVLALDDPDMKSLAKAISSGSLRGARGNSGVILSQLLRGMTKIIGEHEAITVPILTEAFEKAVETAYKAVMKPKEGTILTVSKGIYEKASELELNGVSDLEEFLKGVIEHGDYVLSQTPEMLPVLKQAGVVDSGGQGLMEVIHGAFDAYLGKELDLTIPDFTPVASKEAAKVQEDYEIKFGYCTEFIIMLDKLFNIKHEIDFKAYLESIGDSIVVVADDEVVKVHVHTNDPGMAIQKALQYGALSNMKIDNMRIEHQEKLIKMEEKGSKQEPAIEKVPKKEIAFVAVSVGEGMNEIFKGLGVDSIIEGGQTLNPSTEDILKAIAEVNAENVFVLPNNKNIILAASQAKELSEDTNVIVIPTKTIPQGIAAVINYVPELDLHENEENMTAEISRVRTGQVTYAVRDTMIEDKEIKQGDYMGIGDNGILSVGNDMERVAFEMVRNMMNDELELISIYYGSEVSEEKASTLRDKIEHEFPECDVELQFGGQPIYYYVVSAE
ncbi:MAG: DAK2 domain-containing protein [Lachnospiraceae bacterium]|nr:DAK2 domain-containing protein [Lachnospiraceae bacterium]MDD3660960.1 DAK2 domain-containing protein [Lachnospiraceae bacterium]